MLGFYNYTVVLTYVSLLSSVFGAVFAINGRIAAAAVCLLFSGACDMFDGKIARTKKDRTDEEKNFGIQIDSLCDVVCFGVLPAVILFSLEDVKGWETVIGGLFVLCGVIRLAYFNVTEEVRQSKTGEKRTAYAGLPITASSIAAPLLLAFRSSIGTSFPVFYTFLLAVLGVCYISPFEVRKPGRNGGIALVSVGVVIFVLILLKLR